MQQPKRIVDPKCIPNPFIPDAPCDTSVETQNFGKQNEGDFLEGLGDYRCDTRMSVKNVHTVVNIRTLKGRFISHHRVPY